MVEGVVRQAFGDLMRAIEKGGVIALILIAPRQWLTGGILVG